VDLVAGTVRIARRAKGAGVEARTLPLTDDARAAFADFHRAQAYGPFATESLNQTFKRGCARIGLDPTTVHLYDVRHSYLTEVYRVTHDLATVGRLGLHAPGSPVTARYALGANDEVDRAAVEAFTARLAEQRRGALKVAAPGATAAKKLPGKVARIRKSFKHTRLVAVT
jgi:integrase